MRFVKPYEEIIKRLKFHSRTRGGGMLDGLNYVPEGVVKSDGAEDFPLIQPDSISFNQERVSDLVNRNRALPPFPLKNRATYTFRLSTNQDYGLISESPRGREDIKLKGYLPWLALVLDAIETNVEGVVDTKLCGSLERDLIFEVEQDEATQRSYEAIITIRCDLLLSCAGSRSSEI